MKQCDQQRRRWCAPKKCSNDAADPECLHGLASHNTYPGGLEEVPKAIGVFVKDAEPGFLGVDFQGL